MVNIGNSWDEILKDEWEKPYYLELRKLLKNEYQNYIIHPDMYDIFNALKEVAFEDVKVVILGQDPYHGPKQAHGFSFSVPVGVKIPPSLLNIYKELKNEMGLFIPDNGNLIKWAKQGVLLLNASLTVREGFANSHKDIGWRILTDKIIKLLNERQKPMVFMLWGRFAIEKKSMITNENHLVLTAVHPSPLSAHRGFFGCNHFIKANEFLENCHMDKIDWQIEMSK